MHEQFNIKFEREQLKNQKGTMRKIYIDMKFLIEQSGFGWDQSTGMVTADEDTWDELIQVLCYASPTLCVLRPNLLTLLPLP
jgi:cell cycle checkpoint protein